MLLLSFNSFLYILRLFLKGDNGLCDDNGDCVPPLSCAGDRCTNLICEVNEECPAPLVCINDFCEEKSGSGGACDDPDDCAPTLFCVIDSCEGTKSNINDSWNWARLGAFQFLTFLLHLHD